MTVAGKGRQRWRPSRHDRPDVPREITRALALIRALEGGRRTVRQLAARTDMAVSGVYRYLDYLVAADVPIESATSTSRYAPVVYWIPRKFKTPTEWENYTEIAAAIAAAPGDANGEIARRLGTSAYHAKTVRAEMGVPPLPRGRPPNTERVAAILDRIRAGAGHAEIAREFGVSRQYVAALGARHGMRRPRGPRPRSAP